MKMESLQQRREELERKEYQLKESLLKFDKFLKVWISCFRQDKLEAKCSRVDQVKFVEDSLRNQIWSDMFC